MSLLTELEDSGTGVLYKYAAPTALGMFRSECFFVTSYRIFLGLHAENFQN